MKTPSSAATFIFVAAIAIFCLGCSEDSFVGPESGSSGAEFRSDETTPYATTNEKACWGQATRVFAQMGDMGEHASEFPTPRLGLRNLARALYAAGDIPDDSMQSLGVFVAETLGLSLAACER